MELAAVGSGEAAEVDQEELAELVEVEVKEAELAEVDLEMLAADLESEEVDLEMLAVDPESAEVGLDLQLVEADLDLELAEADPDLELVEADLDLAAVDLEAAEVEVPELVADQLEAASAHLVQPVLLAQVLTLEPNWELDQLAVGATAATLDSLAMDQAESAEAIKPVLPKVTSTATVLEPVTLVIN